MELRISDQRLDQLAEQFTVIKHTMTFVQFIEAVQSGRIVINPQFTITEACKVVLTPED